MALPLISPYLYRYTFFFVACEDGSIRLVGGQNAQEGTLELCSYSIWGLVAVSGWDEKDASVVCNELGFASQGN